METDKSDVIEFFKNKTIFITGGTGFIGKVIVEKLLRTCPEIQKIYLLIRQKKNQTTKQRFESFFDYPCFEPLKSLRSDFHQQVHLINGDCNLINLGISLSDQNLLKEEVNCVIHAAANVKFDQTLLEAASLLRSTNYIITLAKEMKHLKSFVFISTAYSNCIRREIEEKFYDPPITAENFLKLIEILNKEQLENMTPGILNGWPNSYVFVKCLCEDLLKSRASDLPLAIVRPSIIINSFKEPIPGWIDNFYSLIGITVAAGLGIVSSVMVKESNRFNIVPVDHVANATLVVLAGRDILHLEKSTPLIYNITGTAKLNYGKLLKMIKCLNWRYPYEKTLWYNHINYTENRYLHETLTFLLQTVPAYIADIILTIRGRPAIPVALITRLNKNINFIQYFGCKELKFNETNANQLRDGLSSQDKILFDFNTNEVDIYDCLKIAVKGCKLYLFNDRLENLSYARKKMKILFVLHYILKIFLYFLIFKVVYSLFALTPFKSLTK